MPRVVSFIVLVTILLIIGAIFFKVMAQFVLPLFLAAVLVVVFKPLHMWVREQLPGRLRLSSLVTTILIMFVVLLPTAWLGWNAYLEGRTVFDYLKNRENQNKLVAKLEHAIGPIVAMYDSLGGELAPLETTDHPAAGDDAQIADIETPPTGVASETEATAATRKSLIERLKALVNNAASAMGVFLVDIVRGLFRWTVGLIIMVLALYYFLVDGPIMIHTMMRLSPLDSEYEQELLDKFASVSRAVVLAALAAAVVQGVLAGIGFYVALNPGAPIFLLSMLTMVLAVVPFVGAAGVWIPTCLWILFYQERIVDGQPVSGDPVTAIGLAIYCGGVVSTIDNVIKPLVLHGQSNIHPLLALMSILGGIKVLGPVGILVGPMVVVFIHALLIMINKELRLMGAPVKEGRYQKSLFPLHPAFERAAEAFAGHQGSEMLERLASAAADASPDAPASGGSAEKSGPIARVRRAAKRRRRRK